MDCINGLLSLSPYCGLPAPSSGEYVNQISGISTEFTQKIATGDDSTFLDVWNKCLKQSGAELKKDVLLFLKNKVNFIESQYTTSQPYVKSSAELLEPVESELRGVQVILPEGKHVRLNLKGVYLHSASEAEVSIVISDSLSGEVLETLVATLNGGLQLVPINKEYGALSKEIRIEIDASSIQSKPMHFGNKSILDYGNRLYYDSCHSGCCLDAQALEIYPIQAGARVSYPVGVWIKGSVTCSIEAFICEHVDNFVEVLKYKMGEKLLDYKLRSYRVNVFSSSPTELTKENIKECKDRYKELLQLALDQIDYTNEGVCFDCEDNFTITTAYVMP